ncbi:uncharacterized protein BO95DRAFT_168800 [Aspergillus brunneoviolaceus CBS 621.78]|uniref:Uncharacterized protein n=1 Tax=Aspergillus brunneoviolaceus CBS 621.78 TaxID=1450534 RepID=A0ACD1G606_9EURO|nr:hypothetical protein BO95DRAFT_168800 [Aspergillus brunneoviolaceus CBS 621.78]RAH44729.1 hypothetical protein BO95DRAFT_168800 [Aspergillus brunneoviolaceus CBS 621.78]
MTEAARPRNSGWKVAFFFFSCSLRGCTTLEFWLGCFLVLYAIPGNMVACPLVFFLLRRGCSSILIFPKTSFQKGSEDQPQTTLDTRLDECSMLPS